MVHAPGQLLPGQRIGHGLSTQWGSRASADRLVVRDGVFPMLYRVRVGRVLAREPLANWRLLRNVHEVGYELGQSGQKTETSDAHHVVAYDNDNAWSLLAIHSNGRFLANAVSRRAFTSEFHPIDTPDDVIDTFGLNVQFGSRPFRVFESPWLHPLRDARGRPDQQIWANVSSATWNSLRMFACESTRGSAEVILAPSMYRARLRPMPAALARYAVMFYASEVVRYRPGRFDSLQDGRTAWLMDAFTPQSAMRALLSSLCAIDGALIQFHTPATLR